MAGIYKYRKIIDKYTTHYLRDNPMTVENYLTELCEVDDWTYVSVSDEVTSLPKQSAAVEASLIEVNIAKDIKDVDNIKQNSPHVALINDRVAQKISDIYSKEDEIRILQEKSSAQELLDYNSYATQCQSWGETERIKLGIIVLQLPKQVDLGVK